MKFTSLIFIAVVTILVAVAIAGPPRRSWSPDLPKEVATGVPAQNRTAREVDAFFAHAERPTIRTILAAFGQPDGFSAEGYYSGGTLRWLLKDGGDLQVVTDGTFQAVFWASRFDRKGKNTFLTK